MASIARLAHLVPGYQVLDVNSQVSLPKMSPFILNQYGGPNSYDNQLYALQCYDFNLALLLCYCKALFPYPLVDAF